MKNKSLAILSPLCLCLYAAGARAELEPFSFTASESLQHQSNPTRTWDSQKTADWISVTEFSAALDEAVGRSKLVGSAAVNYSDYRHEHSLSAYGYRGGLEFDWNTIGDLSGALGADTDRHQYLQGVTANATATTGAVAQTERNIQTDDHVFGRLALGGPGRWQIFGGADANQRHFSASDYRGDDERQWSSNLGTNYATSPDLSFGVVGNYMHGEYPHTPVPTGFTNTNGEPVFAEGVSRFNTRSVDLTTKLNATGNSAFDASVGYTSENSQSLAKPIHFVNGSLNWTWTPPSHFTVKLGLKRSSDVDTNSTGANAGVLNANNLSGTSINNLAMLDVSYALTAKVTLDANSSYSEQRYSDVRELVPDTKNPGAFVQDDVSGSLRTATIYFSAHYLPTRTTDVNCGVGYERRRVTTALTNYAPDYTNTTVQCAASISFN